jgi:hypothetical protein
MNSGTVTISTEPTLICTLAWNSGGVVVQNTGAAEVILGGPAVSASGAAAGPSLAAGAALTVPGPGPLYGIVASATGTVAFVAAAG